MRLTTRIKEKVDAVNEAELQCILCSEWKLANNFRLMKAQPKQRQAACYHSCCKSCNTLRNKMRVRSGGKICYPSHQKIREALGNPATTSASLNFVRHQSRQSRQISALGRELLDERCRLREDANNDQGYVYLIGEKTSNYAVKIGYSVDPEARAGELQTGNPRPLEVIAKIPGTTTDERRLQNHFIHLNLVGEWFRKDPAIVNAFTG